LDAAPLPRRVAPVAGGALSLLVCHRPGLLGDLGHPHGGDALTVTAAPAVVLAALLLEDQDLAASALLHDLAPGPPARDQWVADPHGVVGGGEEHVTELDCGADVALDPLDPHQRTGLDPILLSSSANDGVGHRTGRRLAAPDHRLYLRGIGESTVARSIIRITLYGRSDCHLCHEMRKVVDAVARALPLAIEEVDVDGD